MLFYFSKCTLTPTQILNSDYDEGVLSAYEKKNLFFAKQFLDVRNHTFPFFTSGSTGKPKKIFLTRKQLEYSALVTLQYLLGTQYGNKKFLLCIDSEKIGGRMVILRALLSNSDLYMVAPQSNPLEKIQQKVDLVSMVPLQIATTLEKNPKNFKKAKQILIGGAAISLQLESQILQKASDTAFYHTYGMTETASHIALRKLGEKYFTPIGDVQLQTDSENRLHILGSVTQNKALKTHDVVKMHKNKFKFIGRYDFVINTGGIKVNPEKVEKKIVKHFPNAQIFVTSTPDEKLGNALVLITDTPILHTFSSLSSISKYEIPKKEIIINNWEGQMALKGRKERNEHFKKLFNTKIIG